MVTGTGSARPRSSRFFCETKAAIFSPVVCARAAVNAAVRCSTARYLVTWSPTNQTDAISASSFHRLRRNGSAEVKICQLLLVTFGDLPCHPGRHRQRHLRLDGIADLL